MIRVAILIIAVLVIVLLGLISFYGDPSSRDINSLINPILISKGISDHDAVSAKFCQRADIPLEKRMIEIPSIHVLEPFTTLPVQPGGYNCQVFYHSRDGRSWRVDVHVVRSGLLGWSIDEMQPLL